MKDVEKNQKWLTRQTLNRELAQASRKATVSTKKGLAGTLSLSSNRAEIELNEILKAL